MELGAVQKKHILFREEHVAATGTGLPRYEKITYFTSRTEFSTQHLFSITQSLAKLILAGSIQLSRAPI